MQNLLIWKPQFIPLFFALAIANLLLAIFFMDVMTIFIYVAILAPLIFGIVSILINLVKKNRKQSH